MGYYNNIYLLVVIIISIFPIVSLIPTVTINNGELIIKNANFCSIMINGDMNNIIKIKINDTLYHYPKYIFGIVEYDCDSQIGTILSIFSCKDCGVYCHYNQLFDQCKSSALLIIIGAVVGGIMFIITILIFWNKIIKLARMICEYLIYKYHIYKVNKDYSRAKEIRKLNKDISIEIKDRVRAKYDGNIKNKVNNKRYKLNNKINNRIVKEDPVYLELSEINATKEANSTLVKPESTDLRHTDIHHNDQPSTSGYPNLNNFDKSDGIYRKTTLPQQENINREQIYNTNRSNFPALALSALLIASQTDISKACDNNLFINSIGQICDQSNCKTMDMFSMPLQSGQSVCFKDTNNDDFSIKIEKSFKVYRYIKLYYTSDWDINTSSYYNCKGTDQCWQGSCMINTIGNRFHHEDNQIGSYGCLTSGLGCDTTCWHQLSCTFYKWYVYSVGPLYPVYEIENSLWEVEISVSYKNVTKLYKLNVNNPSINVDNENFNNGKIPIYVTNYMSEEHHPKRNMIIYENKPVLLDASAINMPENDRIGDYQIDLLNRTRSFNLNSVNCHVESCKVTCLAPIPKVRKLPKIEKNYKDNSIQYKYNNDEDIIIARKQTLATITLMIGNLDIKHLQITPALCSINVNYIYGCKACTLMPYVVFRPINIKQEGMLKFESNCSFDKDYISCNNQLMMLTAQQKYSDCFIYIPKTNQSLTLSFKYEFLGTVNPNDMLVTKLSVTEELKEAAKLPQFWQSLMSTFTICTSISIVLSIILRAFKIYQIRRINKDISDENA